MRENNETLIEKGFDKLEEQYEILPDYNSPTLWIKLPDTMIVLYRQAAQVMQNTTYERREKEISKCFPNLPQGAFETYLREPESGRPLVCPNW